MSTKNKITTNFDLFVDILKLEKDESAYELYEANQNLERISQYAEEVKVKIVNCEQ